MLTNLRTSRAKTANAVFIGRGGPWGNPFRIGRDGTREEVIRKYANKLWKDIRMGVVPMQVLADLHGKELLCFCSPKPCHGNVLMNAAKWAHEQLHRKEIDTCNCSST